MIASDTSLGKLYNLMLYITTRAAAYIWAGVADLTWAVYLIHYYHMSNQQFWRAWDRIHLIFKPRAWRRIHEMSRKNQNKIENVLPSLLRRKETSVYILLLLCWPLSIRRRAASRRTTLVPRRAGLLTGSYLAENIADDRLLLNVDRKFTQMCRMCEESILRYLYINTRLLLLYPPFTDYR